MFWKNKVREVSLDPSPHVHIRVIDDEDTLLTKHEKADKPFKLLNDVSLRVNTDEYFFGVTIPRGYTWNGADIPAPCWWFGSSKDNEFLIPSLVHDYLLEYKTDIFERYSFLFETPEEYRRITSLVFRELCKQAGISTLKANIAGFCVDIYQGTVNRGAWNIEQ